VNLCLKALATLLDDSWTRIRLGSDESLTIELLNVLLNVKNSAFGSV